jgi:hypothetical protein
VEGCVSPLLGEDTLEKSAVRINECGWSIEAPTRVLDLSGSAYWAVLLFLSSVLSREREGRSV